MTQFRRELVPPGGEYPPMAPLPGAVLGWPAEDPLTSVHTPEAARAALLAESQTSVLDPVGLRRLWWREWELLVMVALLVMGVLATVEFVSTGRAPGWWLLWAPVLLLSNLAGTCLTVTSTRTVPADGVVPRWGPARWRWYRDVRSAPVAVPPVAAWPPGSEAYALLSGAACVQSVAPAWLSERVALPPGIGAQWVAVLRREGWLAGGGRALGLSRLPELHVQLTDAGRTRLEQERARLTALAAG